LHSAPAHVGPQSRCGALSNADAKRAAIRKRRGFAGETKRKKNLAAPWAAVIWRNLRMDEKFHQTAEVGWNRRLAAYFYPGRTQMDADCPEPDSTNPGGLNLRQFEKCASRFLSVSSVSIRG